MLLEAPVLGDALGTVATEGSIVGLSLGGGKIVKSTDSPVSANLDFMKRSVVPSETATSKFETNCLVIVVAFTEAVELLTAVIGTKI